MARGHGTHFDLTAVTVPAIKSGSRGCNDRAPTVMQKCGFLHNPT